MKKSFLVIYVVLFSLMVSFEAQALGTPISVGDTRVILPLQSQSTLTPSSVTCRSMSGTTVAVSFIDNQTYLMIDLLTSSSGQYQFQVHFTNGTTSEWSSFVMVY